MDPEPPAPDPTFDLSLAAADGYTGPVGCLLATHPDGHDLFVLTALVQISDDLSLTRATMRLTPEDVQDLIGHLKRLLPHVGIAAR